MKTNQTQRDTVAKLIAQDGDSFRLSYEQLASAADAGLITFETNGNVIILDAGRETVEADKAKKVAQREVANRRARGRNEAARSSGLTHTRYGWE